MRKLIAIALAILLPSTALPQAQTKTSFQEVTSRLDPGGNLYVYLSTEEWLKGLSSQIAQFGDFVNSMPNASPADQQNAARGLALITNLVKQSGIEDVSGFGASSIAIEKDLYRSKAMLHHYRGNDSGLLWSVFGRQPHALDALDLLPANTAYASFFDMDAVTFWSALSKQLAQSGIPDVERSFDSFRQSFNGMGLDFDKTIASLGGECGFALTLDDSTVQNPFLPVPVPDIGLMVVCKVKDETIFTALDAMVGTNPTVVRTNRGGLRMRTMPSPFPMPGVNLRPSVARTGDYLFIASTDSLVETALAVKAGTKPGLKSTDEFKKLSAAIPQQGNAFSFRSKRIAETVGKLLEQADPSTQNQAKTFASFFGAPGTPGSYTVAANTDEGWFATGNTGTNPATTMFLYPTVATTLIVATIAVPSLLRSRQAAQEASAIANLRTIATAELSYAAASRTGSYGSLEALITDGLLDSRFASAVSGYEFDVDVSGRTYVATATPVSSNAGRYAYFVTTDGVVRYSPEPGQAPAGRGGEPVQ